MAAPTNLPLDPIRTFVAVVDHGGFTKASSAVNRTQAAVSMQIKRLEEELGRPLFVRGKKGGGRGVRLTVEGDAFLPYARRILKTHDEAVSAVARPDCTGLVRLGLPDDYVARFMPSILSWFAECYPRVQVYVRCCDPSSELSKRLDRGDLDLSVLTLSAPPLDGEVMAREQVVWAASPSHLAHEQNPLPVAVFNRGCFIRAWSERALAAAGINYRLAVISPSIASILAAVKAGLAVAPLVAGTVPEGLAVLSEKHGFPTLPDAYMVLRKSRGPHSEAVACLAQHVVRGFKEMGGPPPCSDSLCCARLTADA